jgi:hypothetical protein
MAVAFATAPDPITTARHAEAMRRLAAAGADAPAGRRFHLAIAGGDRVRIADVRASEATFDAFARTLLPVPREIGVGAAGPPEFGRMHHLVEG